MIERAVAETIASQSDLVRATVTRTPKAWGTLAAKGVTAFRDLAGRAPTDAERRAIWSGLWRAAHEARP